MKRTRTKWPSSNGNGKHPGGRPSPYNPDYHPKQVYKLISMTGIKDEQLAVVFEVSAVTLWQWKQSHPEFLKAYQAGWDAWAYPKAERSMYQKAVGFTVPEEKVFCNMVDGEPVITRVQTERYYPPDTRAGMYTLQNLSRRFGDDRWKDITRHEYTGANGGPIEHARMNLHVILSDVLQNTSDVSVIKQLRDQIAALPKPVNGDVAKPVNGRTIDE